MIVLPLRLDPDTAGLCIPGAHLDAGEMGQPFHGPVMLPAESAEEQCDGRRAGVDILQFEAVFPEARII